MIDRFRIVCCLLLFGGMSHLPFHAYPSSEYDSHIEVSLRMVGHQVMLSSGDSSSLVLPIERDRNRYTIRFDTEFGFDPERMSSTIDSVIAVTQISQNYIVEFISCEAGLVAHSYEVNDNLDISSCRTREQPVSCYDLRITLRDAPKVDPTMKAEPELQSKEASVLSDPFWIVVLLVLLLSLGGLAMYYQGHNRQDESDSETVQIGRFVFNAGSMQLILDDQVVELTGKEADLLQLLCNSINQTVERETILNAVWGDEGDYVGRTLDVFISKLRKKLEADSNLRIANIRGVGYKLILTD